MHNLASVGSKGYGNKHVCMPNNNPLLSFVLVTDFPPEDAMRGDVDYVTLHKTSLILDHAQMPEGI